MSQLHPIIAQALAPWTPPRTPEEEARWIAADAEADRLKRDDPFRQREQHKLIQEQNDWLRATGGLK